MKKLFVVLAVLFSVALVTSVYAQKWDTFSDERMAGWLAKGKQFKFNGIEIISVDQKAQTVFAKDPNTGRTVLARFRFVEYMSPYNGPADLKAGEKVSGEGTVIDGENWVTKIRPAEAGAKPSVQPAPSGR